MQARDRSRGRTAPFTKLSDFERQAVDHSRVTRRSSPGDLYPLADAAELIERGCDVVLASSASAEETERSMALLGATELKRTSSAEAGGRAGVRCLAVLTGGFSEAELRDAGAERVYRTLADLRDDLDALLA